MSITFPGHDPQYVGAVLDTREENLAHDSYFHAIVWDGEKVTSVETHSTAYGGPWPTVTVDATQETIDAALAWFRPRWLAARVREAERMAAEIQVGRRVRSTTTRGKNVGFSGIVRRCTVNTYSTDPSAMRVQIEAENGETRWMDDKRVEVVDPAPVDTTELEAASRAALPNGWRNAILALV
jgi:hypothetical protein